MSVSKVLIPGVLLLVLLLVGILAIPVAQAATDVSIVDFAFNPADITVEQGSIVTWTNNGAAPHTTTSGVSDGSTGTPDGIWNSGTLSSRATFDQTFNDLGTFPYYCAIHPFMIGSVTVEPAPPTTATPTPGPTATATPTPTPATVPGAPTNGPPRLATRSPS